MIYTGKGTARCDHRDDEDKPETQCPKTREVRLVLGLGGAQLFDKDDLHGWQLVMRMKPGQPVELRCEDHQRKVGTADTQVATLR